MEMSSEELLAIRQEYRNGLTLPSPDKLPVKQFFLCPVGQPGAGKTTVVKPLSKMLSLVRISNDEVRKILKDHGYGYGQLKEVALPLAEDLARQGYSLAFDADCGNLRTRETILKLAEELGAKAFWLHINPTEDFIVHKLRTYQHTWLFKDGDEAVDNYYRQKKKRQEENTHFDFFDTIDTSKPDLQSHIGKIAELIKDELAK